MKNFRLVGLLLALLVTTQVIFAQEDYKQAKKEAALKKEMHDDSSIDMHKELKELKAQYKDADVEEKKTIKEKIKALKVKYNKDVKGLENNSNLDKKKNKEGLAFEKKDKKGINGIPQGRAKNAKAKIKKEEDKLVENEMLIKNGREQLLRARKQLAKEKALGNITVKAAAAKEKKMMKIETKLNNHEALIERSKTKLSKQKETLSKLVDK